MRRGLIAWSREEVPAGVLEGRVARLQQSMRAARLDVVLVYCSCARPAAVSYLTHFVPYWNEALLAVFPSDAPVLLAAFSKRVHGWIRDVSRVGEIIAAPQPGQAAVALLKERLTGAANAMPRVGVVELDALPWSVAEPIVKASSFFALIDATELFSAIRQPADAAEIGLARRAMNIAVDALGLIPADAQSASQVLSAVEASSRRAGAEEVILRVAPDLALDDAMRRIEGDIELGHRYAIELSLAYKATWIRTARCCARGSLPPSWRAAAQWFQHAAFRIGDTGALAAERAEGAELARSGSRASRRQASPAPAADSLIPGKLAAWTLEACLGSAPLSVVACNGESPSRKLPAGALAVLSLQLDPGDGPWQASGPVLLGEGGCYAPLAGYPEGVP